MSDIDVARNTETKQLIKAGITFVIPAYFFLLLSTRSPKIP